MFLESPKSGRAEAIRAASGLSQVAVIEYLSELRDERVDEEDLGDPHIVMQIERLGAAIFKNDASLAAVVGVDRAGSVRDRDVVLGSDATPA
jgi:hypothetical protein